MAENVKKSSGKWAFVTVSGWRRDATSHKVRVCCRDPADQESPGMAWQAIGGTELTGVSVEGVVRPSWWAGRDIGLPELCRNARKTIIQWEDKPI